MRNVTAAPGVDRVRPVRGASTRIVTAGAAHRQNAGRPRVATRGLRRIYMNRPEDRPVRDSRVSRRRPDRASSGRRRRLSGRARGTSGRATVPGRSCGTAPNRTGSPDTPASSPASPRRRSDTAPYSSVRPDPDFGNSPTYRNNRFALTSLLFPAALWNRPSVPASARASPRRLSLAGVGVSAFVSLSFGSPVSPFVLARVLAGAAVVRFVEPAALEDDRPAAAEEALQLVLLALRALRQRRRPRTIAARRTCGRRRCTCSRRCGMEFSRSEFGWSSPVRQLASRHRRDDHGAGSTRSWIMKPCCSTCTT